MPFIGEIDVWDRAEAALRKSLDASGREWTLNEGDGAFYGPKIDVILKDSLGREQQTATIQLDFQLPIRFDLEYMEEGPDSLGSTTIFKQDNKDLMSKPQSGSETPATLEVIPDVNEANLGQEKSKTEEVVHRGVPVMVHRAIFGSVERFMAMLMEHYNGYWPFWLNPHQAIVVPVSSKEDDEVFQFAKKLSQQLSGIPEDGRTIQSLSARTFGVGFEKRPLSLKKKIKMAYADRYQYMIVVGAKEAQSGQFELMDLRNNGKTKQGMSANEIYQHFVEREDVFQ